MSAVTIPEVVEALRRLRAASMPFVDRAALERPHFKLREIRALAEANAEATDIIATILAGEGIASAGSAIQAPKSREVGTP